MKISSMSAEERVRHLTEAPIPGWILELSLPTVISMLVTSLYNMVDTAFVGQLNSQSTAAVGISYSAMALLQAVSFFFGHGSGNYISRKLGAREYDNAERMASTAFFSAVFCGCVLAVLGVVFITPISRLLGSTDTILPYTVQYLRWIFVGAPFIMGAPNTTVDIPAMWEMAEKTKMPIAGKDFKTGQTLVKSGFAPIIGTRCLGLSGWFSTNILGNRDGLVLDEPANFHTKEVSKLSTLESILVPENQPDLYTDYYHKVRINYYPPRNDNKEGWDNIDIFGWMGYPMQIKINFLCRDSILAAPLLLDLVLLSDLAARKGRYGTQRFLSFFLKSPMHDYTQGEVPINHLFQQYVMLKNAIREMGGYEADEEID